MTKTSSVCHNLISLLETWSKSSTTFYCFASCLDHSHHLKVTPASQATPHGLAYILFKRPQLRRSCLQNVVCFGHIWGFLYSFNKTECLSPPFGLTAVTETEGKSLLGNCSEAAIVSCMPHEQAWTLPYHAECLKGGMNTKNVQLI